MHTKTVVLRVRGTIRYWRYVSGEVERDIIAEALREGQKRGVITRQEITKDRKPFAWLQRLLQEAR